MLKIKWLSDLSLIEAQQFLRYRESSGYNGMDLSCFKVTNAPHKNIKDTAVEINFFNNLPIRQVASNVYLLKKIGIISFEVNYRKKFAKCTSWQKALNLQKKRSCVLYCKNQVFERDVMLHVDVM